MAVAELERQATEIRYYALSLIPGLLQTEAYARAVFQVYLPNFRVTDIDQWIVNRMRRAQIFEGPSAPVTWILLDEATLRRRIGGPGTMAAQLRKIEGMTEAGQLRLHVMPFAAGAHSLVEGMLYLLNFEDAPPIAYAEGVSTGHLMDDPARVRYCQTAYDLALSDALSHEASLALIRAVAKEYEHEQQ